MDCLWKGKEVGEWCSPSFILLFLHISCVKVIEMVDIQFLPLCSLYSFFFDLNSYKIHLGSSSFSHSNFFSDTRLSCFSTSVNLSNRPGGAVRSLRSIFY